MSAQSSDTSRKTVDSRLNGLNEKAIEALAVQGLQGEWRAVNQAQARRVAVLVPCYNEAGAISQVIREFAVALPHAEIYVYDNNSTDGTAEMAEAAGAIVRREGRQGKGNVVRRMFSDIDADIYIMVDGDGTYDAASAPRMIRYLEEQKLDMVVGCRVDTVQEAYRPGHRLGNSLLTGCVAKLFG
ncbi:MAG TPA: glycosyltransferase family 2 protein, partial [Steroidobacteraceae bacterium]|nr:glycosyltransferase family 2 protein [Steroidobacteraceae bacterium]